MTIENEYDVRACTPFHGPAVAILQRACFDEDWGGAEIGSLLARPGVFGWLACRLPEPEQSEAEPWGFVLCRVAADQAEILSIGTVPAARRRGVATELMEAALIAAAERGAGRMFLEVAASNGAARAFYAGLGFAEVGRRDDYYGPGEAGGAVVLARDL